MLTPPPPKKKKKQQQQQQQLHRLIYHAEFRNWAKFYKTPLQRSVCQGAGIDPWQTFLCNSW